MTSLRVAPNNDAEAIEDLRIITAGNVCAETA
jgi:hypothetical protein